MVAKTETRPRINVDESALRRLKGFAKEEDLEMDEVYGLALEELADEVRSEERAEIADEIRTRTEIHE